MYCLSYICYCCLKKRKQLSSINSLDSDDISFKDKLIYCQFDININDNIPKLLCQKCCKGLNYIYHFRRVYLKRQNSLKGYINKLQSTNNTFNNTYTTFSIDLINIDKVLPDYNQNITRNDWVIKNEPANETLIDLIIKNEPVENTPQTNDSLIKLEQIDEPQLEQHNTQTSNENEKYEIVKNIEPDLTEFNVVNGGNNVLKIVRKKDDNSLKITLKKSNLNSEDSDAQSDVDKPVITCIFCDSSFANKILLRQHERTHKTNRPYKCKICCRKMYNKYTYRIHFGKHTGDYKFRCNMCNKGLSSNPNLRKHKLTCERILKLKNKMLAIDEECSTPESGETSDEAGVTLGNGSILNKRELKTVDKDCITPENEISDEVVVTLGNEPILNKRELETVVKDCITPENETSDEAVVTLGNEPYEHINNNRVLEDKDCITPENETSDAADVTLENEPCVLNGVLDTVDKDGITPESYETSDTDNKPKKLKMNMSPIRINIKRNQIICNKPNNTRRKRGRPPGKINRLQWFECAICYRVFSQADKLFRHLKLIHNCA